MYQPGIAHDQAHDLNKRLIYHETQGTHGHMNSARMNSVHMNSTRHGTGGRGSRPTMIITLPSINKPNKKCLKGASVV